MLSLSFVARPALGSLSMRAVMPSSSTSTSTAMLPAGMEPIGIGAGRDGTGGVSR